MIDTFTELEGLPRWMAWREDVRRSKRGAEWTTKVPYDPHASGSSFGYGSPTDPATWGTRQQAETRAATLANGRKTGVGYVLGPIDDEWTIAGCDLNSCLDANKTLAPWAAAILDAIRTYAEISPSGSGIKALLCIPTSLVRPFLARIGVEEDAWGTRRDAPGHNGANHGPAIEFYADARYFTVTEQLWDPAYQQIVIADQDTLDRLAPLIPPPSAYVLPAAPGKDGSAASAGTPRSSNRADNSRSAWATRIAIALVPDSYAEMVDGLRNHPHPDIRAWVEDKGEAHNERELQRIWGRFAERRAKARSDELADLAERAGPAVNSEPEEQHSNGPDHEATTADEDYDAQTSWATPATDPTEKWPELDAEAFHGLAGEVVDAIAPTTEADPVAILAHFLVEFGNAHGRKSYCIADGARHYPNLYAVIAGDSSRGRKGTSARRVEQVMSAADSDWYLHCIASGLSSGEGVIHAVHDEIRVREKIGGRGKQIQYVEVVKHPGITDKRLLVIEPEFAGAIEVMKREGSTLSRVVREAYDSGNLRVLTKNSPEKATDVHLSLIGHITIDEYKVSLDRTSMVNGYANRFINLLVKRAQELPFGGFLDDSSIAVLAHRTKQALENTAVRREITFSAEAREMWIAGYHDLSAAEPGLFGSVIARAEAHTLRLALVYALLDGRHYIDPPHLRAALALWKYSMASSRFIFGDLTGDPMADEIRRHLLQAGTDGMTRTAIYMLFSSNRDSSRIQQALLLLAKHRKAAMQVKGGGPGRGRPVELWRAI